MWVDVHHENVSILGLVCDVSKETLPPHSGLNEVHVLIVLFNSDFCDMHLQILILTL